MMKKADSEWDNDTPEKGIKRWVSLSRLTNRDAGITKNLKSPRGGTAKTAENLRIWADSQNYSGKIGRLIPMQKRSRKTLIFDYFHHTRQKPSAS